MTPQEILSKLKSMASDADAIYVALRDYELNGGISLSNARKIHQFTEQVESEVRFAKFVALNLVGGIQKIIEEAKS